MASEDTVKRFFNLGTRHIAIGVIGTAVLCIIVLILASVNMSKLSSIKEDTSFQRLNTPDCNDLSLTSPISDVDKCFRGYFLTKKDFDMIKKLPKVKPTRNVGNSLTNGEWPLVGGVEGNGMKHGCCYSDGSFKNPPEMLDINNVTRKMAQFDDRKQYFYIVRCEPLANCPLDNCQFKCECMQRLLVTNAAYVDKGKLKLGFFFVDGCCVCANRGVVA